ncbi:DUF2129 domain-containing protein [Streptococcus oricebi]|uniref:UPF0298 protein C4K46_05345 n=1 Tax=Streptococcus oricebi TaxID=1547447 RepID=A0ABS5B3G8_9STRE|nr:DUF2129 domain-containing protein [Streptococcus oricebi]MBP2623362.1 hypothetical protein [Streptococcus oricebi]
MFEKEARIGLIVYLYYNRDAKKLAAFGDIIYHSRRRRYLQLYVEEDQVEEVRQRLLGEKYVKEVRLCHIKDLDTNFVGSLFKQA